MKALWAGQNLITLMRLLAAVYLVTLTACGKDDEKTEPETNAQFNSLWSDVFATRCGSCHGVSNTDTLNGPDMRTQDAFHSGLVNKKGTDYPDWDTFQTNRVDCLNIPFISPGNPSQSLIVAIFDDSVTM
jgi:mono/diheme cytochrome c family protein